MKLNKISHVDEKKIPDPKNMWFIVNYLKTLEEFLKTQKSNR